MLELNLPALDIDKANNGKWFAYTTGIKFKIAMHNNPNHRKAMRDMVSANPEMADMQAEELMDQSIIAEANGLLVDWEGLTDNDKPFEPTLPNKIAFLSDPAYKPIREWILVKSQEQASYRRQAIKK